MKKNKKKIFELDFYGKKIIVEHGELAKQATGSVLIRYNDTVVLTAAVVNKNVNLFVNPSSILFILYSSINSHSFILIM